MSALYLVDTSVWIFALRRNPPAAIAQRHEAVLLHADRDFDLIARQTSLVVESLVEVLDT